ncbi:MAG TPA: hypothetical protein ENJ41_08985 [Oceanospirillales bacterium]|nr:hypothetical protein [Oceanospirillales bacterium]
MNKVLALLLFTSSYMVTAGEGQGTGGEPLVTGGGQESGTSANNGVLYQQICTPISEGQSSSNQQDAPQQCVLVAIPANG